jgi:hypothetical protein
LIQNSILTRPFQILNHLVSFNDPDSNIVARATFVNDQLETGWTHLEVVTNKNATDAVQAKAAGMAEGFLTKKFIEGWRDSTNIKHDFALPITFFFTFF